MGEIFLVGGPCVFPLVLGPVDLGVKGGSSRLVAILVGGIWYLGLLWLYMAWLISYMMIGYVRKYLVIFVHSLGSNHRGVCHGDC